MARETCSAGTTLLLVVLGAGVHQTARGPDLHQQLCEFRSGCRLSVESGTQFTSFMGWTGSCENGFVRGYGALHTKHGAATYGKFFKGQARGWQQFRWRDVACRFSICSDD